MASIGATIENRTVGNDLYLLILGILITNGTNAGKMCDVAIKQSSANPWVPESAVHVRPHLVAMGQRSSQASAIGAEWQYLSRRFDHGPTPRNLYAHILTVLGEL
jgi:hypothetical protein